MAPVVATGRGAILVLHDITDLKRADQIRRDFVANVSHELRTPLTAIKGYAEALLDDPDDADARQRFLEIIQRHAARMERLVADLLRLARLDARQELLERVPTDLRALLDGVVDDLEPLITEKQMQVSVEADPGLASVALDPAKVHDIARNLVENAVNYTPAGGTVRIGVTVRRRRPDPSRSPTTGRASRPRTSAGSSSGSTASTSRAAGPAAPGSAWRS